MLDVSEQVELELSSPNSKVSRNPAKFCKPFIDLGEKIFLGKEFWLGVIFDRIV